MARWFVSIAIAAMVIAISAAPARAQEPETWPLSEAIEVSGGACLTRDELLASVENWLGRSAIDRRIQIVVEETEPGRPSFVVLREGKRAAERRFRPSRIACPDLRAAVALAIALAIDATILQSLLEPAAPIAREPRPQPRPRAKPRAEPARARRPIERRPRPPSEAPVLAAEACALVLAGVLPVSAWGGLIGARVLAGPVSVRVAGWATAANDVSIGDGTANVSIVAGELGACIEHQLGIPRLVACAGIAGGGWSAHGRGFDVDRVAVLPWLAPMAGFGLELPVGGGAALVSRVEGYFPVIRPVVEVDDARGAPLARREAPSAGLGASLGAMVGFP